VRGVSSPALAGRRSSRSVLATLPDAGESGRWRTRGSDDLRAAGRFAWAVDRRGEAGVPALVERLLSACHRPIRKGCRCRFDGERGSGGAAAARAFIGSSKPAAACRPPGRSGQPRTRFSTSGEPGRARARQAARRGRTPTARRSCCEQLDVPLCCCRLFARRPQPSRLRPHRPTDIIQRAQIHGRLEGLRRAVGTVRCCRA
jgi:hypothetical protein